MWEGNGVRLGKGVKIFLAIAASALLVAFALAYMVSARVEERLGDELAASLPQAARAAGLAVEFDDLSFNPITGLKLENVLVSTLAEDGAVPLMRAESATLLHSLHLLPEPRVSLEGVRLVKPVLRIETGEGGTTNLPAKLIELVRERGGAVKGAAAEAFSVRAKALDAPLVLARELRIEWRRGALQIDRPAAEEPKLVLLRKASGSLSYDRANGRVSLETGASPGKGEGRISLSAKRAEDDFEIALMARGISLDFIAGDLPAFVGASKKTRAKLHLMASSRDDGRLWNARFRLDVEGVALDHWRLSDRTIGPFDLLLAGALRFDAPRRSVEFERLRLGSGGLSLDASGSADFADGFRLETRVESGRTPIQTMLDALPKGLAPVLAGAQVKGDMALTLDFAIDTNAIGKLRFEPEIEVEGFELVRAPDAVDIERLKKPFMHKARKKGEVVKEFLVGHPNYWFVPFERLGKNTIKGVLTCEDGSFFRHEGFRADHFRESIIQDIRERRFARGASTITMQTAKNLFLSGKKNLSRKFQEILIAYAMERMLTKERILEIYMNIIEWGPKIYGVGEASKHYFDKWPKDLDPLEAAFMGSIIPNASRSHYMYSQGYVPDQWATYLALIVSKMGVSGEDYSALEPFQPEFGWVRRKRVATEGESRANPAISRGLEAEE